jgi:hypothetical protein
VNDGIVALYQAHPMNAEQILADLQASGHPPDTLTPEDLFPLDQDHYGGKHGGTPGSPMSPLLTLSSRSRAEPLGRASRPSAAERKRSGNREHAP